MSEIIGRVNCLAGGRATVQQGNRKGRHFAIRCECCGFNQGTGKKLQQHIWDHAEWINGTPPAPVNVDPEKRSQTEKSNRAKPKEEADFDPETEMTETEEEPIKKGSSKGLWAMGTVAVVGLFAAIASA